METGVIFYEIEQPYVYNDPVFHSFYLVAAKPRVHKYLVRDNPFQHSLASPIFDPNAPFGYVDRVAFYSLLWPFAVEPTGTSIVASGQPSAVEQISPGDTASAGNSSDDSPHSTSEVIIISDDEDIEEIEIVDLISKDDEDLEMDIEIVDLTFESD
ncbi:hypothetical protein AHAS_Ahas15G0163600 [Arachis hypogaea]